MDTLGNRIRKVRTIRKKTQIQFAKDIGISQTHVSKIEKDIEHPSETVLLFISQKYNINIDWLKNGEGELELTLGSGYEEYKNLFRNITYKFESMLNNMVTDEIWNSVDSYNYLYKILENGFTNADLEKRAVFLEEINKIMAYLMILVGGFEPVCTKDNVIIGLENKIKKDELITKINRSILELLKSST